MLSTLVSLSFLFPTVICAFKINELHLWAGNNPRKRTSCSIQKNSTFHEGLKDWKHLLCWLSLKPDPSRWRQRYWLVFDFCLSCSWISLEAAIEGISHRCAQPICLLILSITSLDFTEVNVIIRQAVLSMFLYIHTVYLHARTSQDHQLKVTQTRTAPLRKCFFPLLDQWNQSSIMRCCAHLFVLMRRKQ